MNDNAYKCAYPIGTDITQGQFPPEGGLTKREMFAAMAMQGHIACQQPGYEGEASFIARLSVEHADALLKALEETK